MHYADDIPPKIKFAIFECKEMFKQYLPIYNKLKIRRKTRQLKKLITIWEAPNN